MSEQEFTGSVHYNQEVFVPGFRPCSHVVDINFKDLPELEEANG